MTGKEFKEALKRAGYTQARFAEVMGVHRTVIGRQCAADEVDPSWAFALAGLIAASSANTVSSLVAEYDIKA